MANGDDTSVAQPPAPDDVTPDIQQGEAAAAQATQPAQTAGPNIAPAAAANVMGGTPTLPTVQQPPITIDHRLDDQHMSGLRGILDRVANIMGGGETYHVTKDPDGNVSIDKTPATTGEKWGRIAAAALSGAAAGMGQQGVNAPAKSVAAGFQMGQQVAQAGRTQAEQEAQAQQQLMTRNAQNAYLHQQIIGARFQNQNAPRELARKEAQQDVEFQNFLMDNGGTDWGQVKDMQGVMDLTNAHPELMDHHVGQGGSHLITVPEGNGIHVYSIPTSQTNVRLTEDKRLPDTYVMNDDGMGFTKEPGQLVRKGTKIADFTTGAQGSYAQQEKVITAVSGNKAKAEAAAQPKVLGLLPTPGGTGMAVAMLPKGGGTPTSAVIPGVIPRGAGAGGEGVPLTQDQLNAVISPLTDISSGANINTFPSKQRVQILTEMARRGLKLAHPMTVAEFNRADLANNAVNNIDEAIRIVNEHPEMFGPIGKGRVTFQQLLEGGNSNAAAFRAAVDAANFPVLGIHGFRSRYGLQKLDQLDSDFYTNAESTKAALQELRRSSLEFGKGRVPAPESEGGGTAAPPAAGGTTRQHTMADVPQGAHAGHDANGNIVGYQDATGWHPF